MFYILVRVPRRGWRLWRVYAGDQESLALDELYDLRMGGSQARLVRQGERTPPRFRLAL